jgi:hypothetical protein
VAPPAAVAPSAAGVAAPAPADYRTALAGGHFSEALAQLASPATPAESMDRQLLLWALERQAPTCGQAPGREATLCDGLRQLAAGTAPSPAWRRGLEASGLVSGDYAYRRALVSAVFGPAP